MLWASSCERKMSEKVKQFQPRTSGIKVTRQDGSSFETYQVFAGHEVGCPVDLQIFVGPDYKVEVHAYKPHQGAEIPLCDGPV